MAVERFLTCCRARNSCCFSAMFEMPNLSKSLSMRLRSCPSVRCDSFKDRLCGRPAACSHCAAELSVVMAIQASKNKGARQAGCCGSPRLQMPLAELANVERQRVLQ